ncbi:hypothetical protein HHL16_16230 [Pseudoflavitalea sp. G-6-1-2]|uniref:hypothetical protein n=1 Tax=Pseudoflavitalea sp. G-6-1-2 TaxID=2728841 RepID=UPI00146D3925|nr:hypothetical protein [Pseudoflavitalea sp. G-6-1-2]NML22433.1 hypothetical protein [Pseudoflavitalea sp. G-6-1-2]
MKELHRIVYNNAEQETIVQLGNLCPEEKDFAQNENRENQYEHAKKLHQPFTF